MIVPDVFRSAPTASRARLLSAALSLASVLLIALGALAEDASCNRDPIVVKIHADWCRTCKAVDSVWKQLRADMGDRVDFVVLDVSDRVAFNESQSTARELGLEEFFSEYRSKTGTIAILDCNSLEPVAVMNGERDPGRYQEAIAKASHSS